MPKCIDLAVQALTAEGIALGEARRAATMAFWLSAGKMPAPGIELEEDLAPRARELAAVALAAAGEEVATLEAAGGLEDLASFAEGDAPPKPKRTPRLLREALLLRPGTFNGHTFTKADLEQIEANFNAADPPPIQLDHSLSAKDTQGYVRGVRMSGDELRGLLEFRGRQAVRKVEDGLWRKLSAGVYLKPQKRLKEVSATPFPAVGGDQPARVLTHGGNDPMTAPGTPAGQPAAPAPIATAAPAPEVKLTAPEAPVSGAAPIAPAATPAPAPEAKLSATAEAMLAEHQAKIQALEAQLAQQAQEVRLREDLSIVENLTATGRITPGQADETRKFIATLSVDQRTAYVGLLEKQPAQVTFGRRSVPDTARPGGPTDDEEFAGLMEAGGYKKDEKGNWARA